MALDYSMCISPIVFKTPGTSAKTNFTEQVPCQKCVVCLTRRKNAWCFRLEEEKKVSTSCVFVTLTYENAPVTPNGLLTLRSRDLTLFWKRLRKGINSTKPLRYYACGEYGGEFSRPHYHAIIFNLPQSHIENPKYLLDAWQNQGIIDIAKGETGSIRYVASYVMKDNELDPPPGVIFDQYFQDDRAKEFNRQSKHLGQSYLTPQMIKYHKESLRSYVTLPGGFKTSLPRYYADKIWDIKEKALIKQHNELLHDQQWIKKFDESYLKQVTWKNEKIRKEEKMRLLKKLKCQV